MEQVVTRALALALALAAAAGPAHADLRVLIVSGLGGEPQYESKFRQQATSIAEAARRATGDPEAVRLLTGNAARKEAIERELRALAERTGRDDRTAVVLIGHGSFDGEEYRFNLPGPDITGSELARLLDRVPAREQLVVNATSASGAVAESWKRPHRIVVTATKSGSERNATRFAEFWAQALTSEEADRDKNEIITAAEAFDFASRKVADTFKSDAALATEHARLEGGKAEQFLVARLGDAPVVPNDATLAALLAQQSGIERQLDELKGRKQTLDRETYYDELEKVLVALARLDRSIERRRADLTSASSREPNAGRTR